MNLTVLSLSISYQKGTEGFFIRASIVAVALDLMSPLKSIWVRSNCGN